MTVHVHWYIHTIDARTDRGKWVTSIANTSRGGLSRPEATDTVEPAVHSGNWMHRVTLPVRTSNIGHDMLARL